LNRIILYTLFILCTGIRLTQAQSVDSDSLSDDPFESYANRLDPESRYLWLGIGYATGIEKSIEEYGPQEYVVTFGGFTERSYWLQYYGSYMNTPIHRTSNPSFPIKDGLSLIEAGMEYRSYVPAAYSSIGNYYSLGAGLVYASWHYSAPIGLAETSESSLDYTLGCDLHCGTGFILGRSEPLSCDVYVTPGVVLFLMNTVHGYSNGIFPPLLYLKVRLSLSAAISSW